MKKAICFLVVSMVVLMTLVACGSNSANEVSGKLSPIQANNDSPEIKEDKGEPAEPERPLPNPTPTPDTVEDFSYYLDERIPDEVREVVIGNRERLFVNINPNITENPGEYLALDYDETVDDAIVETLENAPDAIEMEGGIISFETLQKELDFLMNYLKYAYGAYQYYGGDDVFLPMRETIIKELQSENSSGVSHGDYSKTLLSYLSGAITDCHFMVGEGMFEQSQRYLLQNAEFNFSLENGTFYVETDGKKYELISVNGLTPSDMLIPYLNEDGFMTWIIGRPSIEGTKESCTVLLYQAELGEIIEKDIVLTGITSSRNFPDTMYNEYDINGVRVVESRRCQPSDNEADMDTLWVDAAKNLRDTEIIIVDLRNNSGGNSSYPRGWMSALMEDDYSGMRGVFASRRTKTTYYTHGHLFAPNYEGFLPNGLYENWSGPYMSENKPYDNKNKIFIALTNHRTNSAGEDFVDYLRQTENTIVVGTNTRGAYSTGNVAGIRLPYSNVRIRCGYNLHLEPDLTSIEGIGILPDIWTPPNMSLERVMKFIENYELAN